MTVYDVLDRLAELKGSQDGKKYDYSRARLKENYNQFVELWKTYYSGSVQGVHITQGFNGESFFPVKRQSMKLPKMICEKWSTMLFTEAFKISLKNETETEKFRILEKQIDFRSKLNQATISGYALGTASLLASADIELNTETETITGGKVKLDIVKYDSIFPLVFDQNDIKSIAFIRTETIKDKTTYTISIHTMENEQAKVENIQAEVKNNKIEFSTPETIKNSQVFKNQMFCVIRPNTINDYSDALPFGQSIFADALAPATDVDLAADGLRRDLEESGQTMFVGRDLLLEGIGNDKKKKIFDNTKGRFFVIPQKLAEQGTGLKQLFEKYVPEIRVTQFWQVIKDSLTWAAMTSGLGKNNLDIIPQTTATGVIHTEAEKMQNKSLHEQLLEVQIIKIVKALCELSTMTGNPIDAAEINIVWSDSIIVDTTSEKNLTMREVDMGLVSKEEYRIKFYGETTEEAAQKISAIGKQDDPYNLDFMRNTG